MQRWRNSNGKYSILKAGPSKHGHREAVGDTQYLKYRVVDGVVELWEPRDPSTPQPKKNEPPKYDGLAKRLVAATTGTGGPCSCGAFQKYIEATGTDDVDALAQRLIIESRRRVDELEKQADEAEERADTADQAVRALTIEKAWEIIESKIKAG